MVNPNSPPCHQGLVVDDAMSGCPLADPSTTPPSPPPTYQGLVVDDALLPEEDEDDGEFDVAGLLEDFDDTDFLFVPGGGGGGEGPEGLAGGAGGYGGTALVPGDGGGGGGSGWPSAAAGGVPGEVSLILSHG